MPLVTRAAARPHTTAAFRAAAGARYREAVQLEVGGHRLAAVYLFGYAAEMLLKAAYFRLAGWAPAAIITHAHLNAAKATAIGYGLTWAGNLHDLTGWSRFLIHERVVRGQAFGALFRNQLQSRVNQLYRHWREWLRYHDMMPYRGEVAGARAAANWLLTQYPRL
ncbi:MAG: hypothetical protein J0I06_24525 [Planctomycetes bacterium]|nr:hypothetical protein [Planctomycetota bacterium]